MRLSTLSLSDYRGLAALDITFEDRDPTDVDAKCATPSVTDVDAQCAK
jgi:hypothetical protein